jgi:hypothetical protein
MGAVEPVDGTVDLENYHFIATKIDSAGSKFIIDAFVSRGEKAIWFAKSVKGALKQRVIVEGDNGIVRIEASCKFQIEIRDVCERVNVSGQNVADQELGNDRALVAVFAPGVAATQGLDSAPRRGSA